MRIFFSHCIDLGLYEYKVYFSIFRFRLHRAVGPQVMEERLFRQILPAVLPSVNRSVGIPLSDPFGPISPFRERKVETTEFHGIVNK
jgi:hypothetical protein